MKGLEKCFNGLCPIPSGPFKMGSENGEKNERPAQKIFLSEYKLQRHPVTVGEYRHFFSAIRGSDFQAITKLLTMPELPKGFDASDQPMVNVTWKEAHSYCLWMEGDLPTEAQWERGAKGLLGDKEFGTKSGALTPDEAHYNAHSTAPVCSKPENEFGLCDMAGNVWQWTRDWYDKDAYQYMSPKNPTGPILGVSKVMRGGSWRNNLPDYLRAAKRNFAVPDYHDYHVGFRCAFPDNSKK